MSDSHSLPLTHNEPPVLHKTFTSFGADINLRTQSGYPPHAAQRLEVHNDETTTQDIVLLDLVGNSAVYEIPADSVRILEGAFTGIVASGTQTIASVNAHWWVGPGYRNNP